MEHLSRALHRYGKQLNIGPRENIITDHVTRRMFDSGLERHSLPCARPLFYIVLLACGAGQRTTFTGVSPEDFGDRLIQAAVAALATTAVIWYLRKEKQMSEDHDPVRDAMRFFGKARDAYSEAGFPDEAKECDLVIGKISHIALDARISMKF